MIPAETILYTWLDVDDVLLEAQESGAWPVWLFAARTYLDSLTLIVREGSRLFAEDWIHKLFDPRVVDADESSPLSIALEGVDGQNRVLNVIVEEAVEPLATPRLTPTFSRPGLLLANSSAVLSPSPFAGDSARIFVFHSFKGGVGRTMHALALAAAIADRHRRVLLIDADFEAPGITWTLGTRLPNPPISFADVLALAHGDSSLDLSDTVALAAARLRDADLDGILVLPAFRSAQSFTSLEIRPEHLLQSHSDPFLLTNLLQKLSARLEVDAVIVDLRAGLSELSAGLLLDPRVQRLLVTTLSGQSIKGTLAVLELIAKRAPSQRDDDPYPNVILNQVPLDTPGTEMLRNIEEDLLAAISKANRTPEGTEPLKSLPDLLRGPTLFDQSLVLMPASWDAAMTLVRRSNAAETVRAYAEDLPTSEHHTEGEVPITDRRSRLISAAADLIYAEHSTSAEFLATSPLRRLAIDHKTQVPITVVVGAKGAGKTYTFLQLIRRRTWSRFAADAASLSHVVDADLAPILSPLNLSESAGTLVQHARENAARLVGADSPISDAEIRDHIRTWLRLDLHEGEWRERWLDLLAWAVGFGRGTPGAGRAFISQLRDSGRKVIVAIDGLEDVLQDLTTNVKEQAALRALLQELPNWLAQEPDRPLGAIIFVRRDMVLNAVKQNPGQLISKYEPYSLRWDRAEALRLVLWVCLEANCVERSSLRVSSDLTEAELVDLLVPLWGRKLGPDRSREGRSAEWVVAALSDFRGQIQARDLVRFLYLAAKKSALNPETWSDRILVPNAIRDAVADCSKEKIEETLQENPRLGEVLNYLRNLAPAKRWVPFSQKSVQLTPEQLALLEINGVVIAEHGEYYMPEIFRRGLGFGLPQGARPKVLALARRRS